MKVNQDIVSQQITGKLKTLGINKGLELAGKSIWVEYKQKFPNDPISPKLDQHAENDLINIFEEIEGMLGS